MLKLNKENILIFLRENKEYLFSQYGVKTIGLMGSYARDEQTNDSDIDFIVDFDEISYSKLAGLVIYLESVFSRKVDIIRKRNTMRESLLMRQRKKQYMHDLIEENLKFILESIDKIAERILKINSADELVNSPHGVTILDSLAMRLQSNGETVKQIEKRDSSLLQKYPEVDWQQIIRMRDLISHHYEDIDHEIVYNLCKTHLPQLKTTIGKIITDLNKN